jgi:dehydrogenase/reductase SDR family protein 12
MSVERHVLMPIRAILTFSIGSIAFSRIGCRLFGKDLSAQEFRTSVEFIKGKNVIVTGANAGIGFETCKQLAALGARVHLVVRDLEKGNQAAEQIAKEIGLSGDEKEQIEDRLIVHQCDVSDLDQIRNFCANQFVENELHALVHNAGCMIHEYKTSKQGIEINSATNIVGPYLFTKTLVERRRDLFQDESRVIFVTSGGMLTQKLRTTIEQIQGVDSDMPQFDGLNQYARNKRQEIAICEKFARDNPQIGFYNWHPGWVDTPGVQTSMPQFRSLTRSILRQSPESVKYLVNLVISPKSRLEQSALYLDGYTHTKHIPLLGTRYSIEQVDQLSSSLDQLINKQ